MSKLYTCTKCGKKKQKNEFYARNTRPKGISSTCKLCISTRDKEIYQENKDTVIAQRMEYYHDNKEVIGAKRLQFRKDNLEHCRERDRNSYAIRKLSQPGYSTAKSAKRHARKLNTTPSWLSQTDISKIRSIYKTANTLFKKSGIKYHVGHIVPLQGENVCGLHVPWNLQVIPATENCSKQNKLID